MNKSYDEMYKKFQTEVRDPYKIKYGGNMAGHRDELIKELSKWIAEQKEKLIIAWWAQHGFMPDEACIVEKRVAGAFTYSVCRRDEVEGL